MLGPESIRGARVAVAAQARDDDEVRSGIERWLRARFDDLGDATVAPLTRPSAGLSSDTVFVSAAVRARVGREFVLRLPATGAGLFPADDLEEQARFQNAVAAAGVPVAAPAWFEPNPSWVGAPFVVMPRCTGRVVSTNPSYLAAGWLVEAPVETRTRLIESFLTRLAGLHRLDPDRVGVRPTAGLEVALSDATDYLTWAAGAGDIPAYLTAASTWCADHLPEASSAPSVLWGDVQFANCVFTDDGTVAAFLDFELAGCGPAELDLGWFFALHDMTVAVAGRDLDGFGDRASKLAIYERALGRPVADLRWYEVFALLRSGAIMVRIARILAAQGVDDSWLTRGNPTESALARVMSEE